jgi:hypothetical protein
MDLLRHFYMVTIDGGNWVVGSVDIGIRMPVTLCSIHFGIKTLLTPLNHPFGAHTIRQFTTRQNYNSPTLQFANITIRQHYNSPTLQFTNLQFANITIRQHYNSPT